MSHPPLVVYCEHGALSQELRALETAGVIKLVHFPHDPDSRSRRLDLVPPAQPTWVQGAQVTWAEVEAMNLSWEDASAAGVLPSILGIIGSQHRTDAQHLEVARQAKCAAFVTEDTDILDHAPALETLLGFRILARQLAPAVLEGLSHGLESSE